MSSSNVVEQRFFHLESVSRFCTREWEAAREERPDFMFVGFIEQRAVSSEQCEQRAVCSVSSLSSVSSVSSVSSEQCADKEFQHRVPDRLMPQL